MQEVSDEFSLLYITEVERNQQGTPIISSIFSLARKFSHAPILAYVNADIILLPNFITSLEKVAAELIKFLVIGQRWDLNITEEMYFANQSDYEMLERSLSDARLHPPGGSDYFIFPRSCFNQIPPFALGRAGWDNWMIFEGRRKKLPVIDGTKAITVVHQTHDYAHLPGGQPHYKLPETDENVILAGGQEMVFTIRDATWQLDSSALNPGYHPETTTTRKLESAIYSFFGPGRLSRCARMLFHPGRTMGYYLERLRLRFFP